jgi:formiminotetrahydrofolate cyclodeaminase
MRDENIAEFLRRLAARTAAPGGGATAALHAAQAAALIAMVARFSDGPRYDARVVGRVLSAADALISQALELAEADATAFATVPQAYRLPRTSPEEQQARSRAIAEALARAARPPADLLVLSGRLVGLAGDLLPTANRNLVGDLLAAVASARAAAEISRGNIEANMAGITDHELTDGLCATVADAAAVLAQADDLAKRARQALANFGDLTTRLAFLY